MQAITTALLEKLANAQWFDRLGEKERKAVVVVSSWQEALESCNADEWGDTQLAGANLLRERVQDKTMDRYQQWNDLVRDLKPHVKSLVDRKTKGVVKEHRLPKAFTDSVMWDILNACLECEYADLCSPSFYDDLANWYIKGHFPCGWEGNFPAGKLIIY